MGPITVAVHPASSGNPMLRIVEQGFAADGDRVVPFPDEIPHGGLVLLHWSEGLWAGPSSSGRSRGVAAVGPADAERTAVVAALDEARRRGSRVLWVRHNTVPFRWRGSVEAWDDRVADLVARIDGVVHLHRESVHLDRDRPWDGLPAAIIPHPRYEPPGPTFSPAPDPTPIVDVLLPGGIEERKGYRGIVGAALRAGLRVTVAGKPNDRALVRRLRVHRLLTGDRLTIHARYIADAELDALLGASRAVLMDQPRQRNSGVVWLALSRGAVVIGVDSPALRAGRDVVGPDWVRVIPRMTPDAIRAACRRPAPPGAPSLERLVTGVEFAARLKELAGRPLPGRDPSDRR